MENLDKLIDELRKSPTETGWLEFKHDNYDFDMVGMSISALANSAAMAEKRNAYMIWGIHDVTHEIIGTCHDPYSLKKGNQEIESWLRNHLSPNADFDFHTVVMNDKKVVVLIICRAISQTVTFNKAEYIRVGSYTKKLNDCPAMRAQLWDRLRSTRYEELLAKKDMQADDALRLLDVSMYFDARQEPQPSTQEGIVHYMLEEGVVVRQDNGLYGISNMGAILFAKRISDFPNVARKAIRVVQYRKDDRMEMLKENVEPKGYVLGFSGLMKYLEALLPSTEVVRGAMREKHIVLPLLAIREAVANALIHQDFSITGTGPVVEIFETRIEITNPGVPLVDIWRIVDNPPKSRNEKLASLMRRLRMCEELGTGWDKIVISCEMAQLPAPKIDLYEENTRVTLFYDTPFASLSMESKLWACYLHACIKQVSGDSLTNSSLRARFGLPDSASASVSRLIKETMKKKLIRPLDASTAPRYMKYRPFWA